MDRSFSMLSAHDDRPYNRHRNDILAMRRNMLSVNNPLNLQALARIVERHNISHSTVPDIALPIIDQIVNEREQYLVLTAYLQLMAFQNDLVFSSSNRDYSLFDSNHFLVSRVSKDADNQNEILRLNAPRKHATDVLYLIECSELRQHNRRLICYWVDVCGKQYAVYTLFHIDCLH